MTLSSILTLDALGDDTWRAWTPSGTSRPDIFGGQVAAQALLAAAQTVDPLHLASSVHCSFLRRGQPTLPLDIRVERIRAGRTYSSRRVEVGQEGKSIFTMLASFHADEPGPVFEPPMPAGVPDPDALPTTIETPAWDPAFEIREPPHDPPAVQWWARVIAPLPDEPALHQSALLYASDLRAGGAAMLAIGYSPFGEPVPGQPIPGRPATPGGSFGSLDHALWFHRVPRVDDWFFCHVRPLIVRDSRGLVLGTMFDRDRNHVATFTQEMFLKTQPPPG